MTIVANLKLGDNPSNEEILDALDTMQADIPVGADPESDGVAWTITVARYLNDLGPDPSDRFGHMRYDRVATVANG